MANEFIIRKGFKSLQDSELTGSLNLSGNIVAGGTVEASFASNTSTAISGAFDSVSSSLSSRIADQESFSSSLDSTYATDAQVSTAVSALNTATSSYALKNSISGSFTSLSSSLASELLKNTTDTLTGDLTVTGTLTAQDLHVQEVTSSVVFSSGSNKFGTLSTDTQKFTGSLEVNGSSHYLLGDVGIGTAGPETALHLYTSGTSNKQLMIDQGSTGDAVMSFRLAGVSEYVMGIDNSDSDKFKIANSGTVGTSTLLTIDSSGNVGIGTDSPNQLLEISKNGSPVMRLNSSKTTNGAAGDSIGRIEWRGSNNAGNGAGIKAAIDTSATTTTQRDFNILFKTSNNVGSGEPETRMQINANGNVGIGTTSPASKLEVYGGNSGTNDVDRYVRFKASNGEKRFDFYMGGTGNASSLGMYTSDGTTKNVQIAAGGTSYFNAGNVGIGTASPNRQLSIYGTNDGYISFDGGRVGNHEFVVGSDTAGFIIYDDTLDTYRFVIDQDSGNVGIGTTTPAHGKLVISSNQINSSDYTWLLFDNQGSGYGDWNMYKSGNNDLAFGYGTSNGASFSNALTLKFGGNVGIGETSPLGKLHVKTSDTGVTTPSAQGNLLVLEDSENGLSILSSTAGAGYINFGDSDDNNIGMIIYGHSTNSMDFWTNASKRMTIDSGGDIGIGTATPRGDLHLYGGQQDIVLTNTNADGVAGLTISRIIGQARGYSNTSSVMQSIDFVTNSSTWYKGDIVFKTNNTDGTDSSVAASERMRIFSGGNVNIGVGEAGAGTITGPFVVTHTSSRFLTSTYEESTVSLNSKNGNNNLESLRLAGDSIKFWNGTNATGSQSMVINNSGNVGIGSSTPVTKLDVIATNNSDTVRIANTGTYGGTISFNQGSGHTNIGYIGSLRAFEGNGTGDNGVGLYSRNRISFYLNSASPAVTIGTNGLLGIGTTAPSRELDIQASSGWAEIALRGNTGGGGSLEFWTNTTKRAEIFADTEDIVFRNTASNKERLRIDSNGIMYIMGATASTDNSLQMQYNSTAGTAEIYSKSTGGNTSFEFYASNAGTTNKVVTFDKEGIITSKTNNGAYTATHLRTITVPYSGNTGTFTFDIDPVATFGTRVSGGRMKLEVSGWGTRMNAGYIVYRNDGSGSSKIGTGDVVYYRYAWSETSGTQAMVAVSLPSSSTNVVRISFSGWHGNDHGFEARLTATS